MRVLQVGSSGLLGSAVAAALVAQGDSVVSASRSGEEPVDLTSVESIAELYSRVGPVDAVVCTAGVTPFGKVGELSVADYASGIVDKLLGQIALVTLGLTPSPTGGASRSPAASFPRIPPPRAPSRRPSTAASMRSSEAQPSSCLVACASTA